MSRAPSGTGWGAWHATGAEDRRGSAPPSRTRWCCPRRCLPVGKDRRRAPVHPHQLARQPRSWSGTGPQHHRPGRQPPSTLIAQRGRRRPDAHLPSQGWTNPDVAAGPCRHAPPIRQAPLFQRCKHRCSSGRLVGQRNGDADGGRSGESSRGDRGETGGGRTRRASRRRASRCRRGGGATSARRSRAAAGGRDGPAAATTSPPQPPTGARRGAHPGIVDSPGVWRSGLDLGKYSAFGMPLRTLVTAVPPLRRKNTLVGEKKYRLTTTGARQPPRGPPPLEAPRR